MNIEHLVSSLTVEELFLLPCAYFPIQIRSQNTILRDLRGQLGNSWQEEKLSAKSVSYLPKMLYRLLSLAKIGSRFPGEADLRGVNKLTQPQRLNKFRAEIQKEH